MNITNLFRTMIERGASDLFLRTKAYPRARISGQLEVIGNDIIEREEMQAIANYLLANEDRRKKYLENFDIDFIHEDPEAGRFRINIFTQRGTPAIVARHVHSQIKPFEELLLPADVCKKFCEENKGLFLVSGPAGNGKSTTIASMLEHINQTQNRHILTIEDPIEYLFTDKKSIVNQRELELDVPTYKSALKHVTQQSPDILFIGNIRDETTMKAAITATELGVFVMSTFHTVNAVQTIMRIINFFPPHLHEEIRNQLAMILKGTISLRLLPRKDGQGRVPAIETMVSTPTVARLIREGSIREIQGFIEQGDSFGMQSFKASMVKLVKEGIVDEEEAQKYADSKDDFSLALKGISQSGL